MVNRGVLIQKFFEAYPGAEVFDNTEELRERINVMGDCVQQLRTQAIANCSKEELRDMHVLEHELSIVVMLVQQRHAARMALVNGGGIRSVPK